MLGKAEVSAHWAELAVFARKSAALDAAAGAGLSGRFESFCVDELRVSMATAGPYGFLNTIEGVSEESVEVLPDALERFPDPRQVTVVATGPSQSLRERLLSEGYEQAPVRPIAYLNARTEGPSEAVSGWEIHEVCAQENAQQFLDLLTAGYAAPREVSALIRAEHTVPAVRGFIACRDGEPLAAAAMSLHPTGAVLGGASTLHAARGNRAQAALLTHRLHVAEALNISLTTATAAPGTSSIRNLAHLGFTIVERTAWRHRFGSRTGGPT
ncbi:hypothetical protein FQ377_13630 [Arthrobacter echini]|uniref:N-acetyltransferase domain-containing protein n=1 Tax=Arthrobacter echini TaxID=1529066 RepID=A0A5D0XJ79_9MICC|nr:hypothetical protein [Arthrobacter echini]TYC96624.1 hypothetical protein FQ377_13630 [Arthrobacter echini]